MEKQDQIVNVSTPLLPENKEPEGLSCCAKVGLGLLAPIAIVIILPTFLVTVLVCLLLDLLTCCYCNCSAPSSFHRLNNMFGLNKRLARMFMDGDHYNAISRKILRTPADYGMKFTNVTFQATDGCDISAWYIPAKNPDSKKLAILAHQSWSYANKSGMPGVYMPMLPGLPGKELGIAYMQPIDYVKIHKVLHEDGFHVLAYDLRNHGESEHRLPSGWGAVEFMDAAGAMDYVNAHPVLKDCKVALLSFCVTGVATMKANSHYPEKFKNVECLVTTNLFTVRNMWTKNHLYHAFMMPGGGRFSIFNEDLFEKAMRTKLEAYIQNGDIKANLPHVEFTVEAMSATKYAADIKVPVLYCPMDDRGSNQVTDVPAIRSAFMEHKDSECHFIGTAQEGLYKTTSDNRSVGYNYFHTENGSQVLRAFFRKVGL